MVRSQSISLWRGRRLRAARFRLPRTAWTVLLASRRSSSSTTLRTTWRGGLLGLLRDDAVERDQGRDEVDIGLDRLEHFGFEQHLLQAQALEGVLLHHAHDRGREVGADVAEPARHVRRGSAAKAPLASRRRRARRAPGPYPGPPRRGAPPSAFCASPPSTSRQRRRRLAFSSRSWSTPRMWASTGNPGRPGRWSTPSLPGADGACRPLSCLTFSPIARRSGGWNRRRPGARAAGACGEGVGQAGQPGVERRPEAVLLEEQQTAAAHHAGDPGGGLRRRHGRREREPREPCNPSAPMTPSSSSSRQDQPRTRPCTPSPRQAAEGGAPCPAGRRGRGSRSPARGRCCPPCPRRLVVERGAGAGQPHERRSKRASITGRTCLPVPRTSP